MVRVFDEYLFGLVVVVVGVATVLATAAFLAPTFLPEPFSSAAAASDLWIVATAALTILGALGVLLVMRASL